MGLMAKKLPKGGSGEKGGGFGFDASNLGSMMDMLSGFTLLRLTGMMGMINVEFTKEELLDINSKLIKIKAPKK